MGADATEPLARVAAKFVLNAFTTWAPGRAAAYSAAALPASGLISVKLAASTGLQMSTTTLSLSSSPSFATMSNSAVYGTARTTMSPSTGVLVDSLWLMTWTCERLRSNSV